MDEIICRRCQSTDLRKNGLVFGRQRYKCKKCGYQFTKTSPHGKSAKDKNAAVALCRLGVSQNQTAKILGVTPPSVARWLEDGEAGGKEERGKANVKKIEETNLRGYIKQLYLENKENFWIVQNNFKSGYEVDILIKNRHKHPQNRKLMVCAFGDSILQGVVHDAKTNRYLLLKENFLALSGAKLNVNWKNYARHGALITSGEAEMRKHLDYVKASDYIFFSFGGNDCNMNWDEVAENPYRPHQPFVQLPEFHQRYVNLIHLAQEKGKTPILFSLPPVDSEVFFAQVSKYRNADNILRFLYGDIHNIYQWHSMYNMEIFKIANETNVPIVDITTYFLAKINYRDFLCDDGVHPNEKGHQLIAEALKRFYEQYFC
ncbi:MAG: hypothetical protein IJ529_00075 [Alphaproteobacteria bacterium]|nr:hypothetical protein [Alphaproteobacteria bacterium]MBQ9235103.1 hypothetical protein [Alphaproteobacteria bacterium]